MGRAKEREREQKGKNGKGSDQDKGIFRIGRTDRQKKSHKMQLKKCTSMFRGPEAPGSEDDKHVITSN